MNINLNLEELKDVSCKQCGSIFFNQIFGFKILPDVHPLVAAGQGKIIPLPMFTCVSCGTPLKTEDMEKSEEKSKIIQV